MSKRTVGPDGAYAYGRSYPNGDKPAVPRPKMGSGSFGLDGLETKEGARLNVQRNEFVEDRHAPCYDNDVSARGWLRSGDATKKPGFDMGNAWRGGKLREK